MPINMKIHGSKSLMYKFMITSVSFIHICKYIRVSRSTRYNTNLSTINARRHANYNNQIIIQVKVQVHR